MPPQVDKTDDEGQWVWMKDGLLFVIDSEDHLQPLPLHVFSQRQYDRCHRLEDSFRRERV